MAEQNVDQIYLNLTTDQDASSPSRSAAALSSDGPTFRKMSCTKLSIVLISIIAILSVLCGVFIALYIIEKTGTNKCLSKASQQSTTLKSTFGSFPCNCHDNSSIESELNHTEVKMRSAKSCKDIQEINSNAKSGVYKIKTDNYCGYSDTYCQMTSLPGCSGGGWTMVMKINGTKGTFKYFSPYWSDKQTYNPLGGLTAFDDQETKLPAYWSTSFKEICVGMKVGNDLNFVSINYPASSLYSLIANGKYRATNIGRQRWKSLINDSSLQSNCNKEGFNVKPNNAERVHVRLGIAGNEQNDCFSPDSFIGLGGRVFTNNKSCATPQSPNAAGNVASCGGDNGNKDIKAMGYILVR